jgi:hypothetical protein
VLGAIFEGRRPPEVAEVESRPVAPEATEAPPAQTPAVPAPPPSPAVPVASPAPPIQPRPAAPAPAIAPEVPAAPAPALTRRQRRSQRFEQLMAEAAGEPVQAAGEQVEAHPRSLRIELLVWAADPDKRMVYLNGRKFVEGEAVEAGTVVEQILEDGVVLLRQGQRIRLRTEGR